MKQWILFLAPPQAELHEVIVVEETSNSSSIHPNENSRFEGSNDLFSCFEDDLNFSSDDPEISEKNTFENDESSLESSIEVVENAANETLEEVKFEGGIAAENCKNVAAFHEANQSKNSQENGVSDSVDSRLQTPVYDYFNDSTDPPITENTFSGKQKLDGGSASTEQSGQTVTIRNQTNSNDAQSTSQTIAIGSQQLHPIDSSSNEAVSGNSFFFSSSSSITQKIGQSSGSIVIDPDELFGGSGQVNSAVSNNGILSPGHSPGIQNLAEYIQGSNATLLIEIGGLTPGPGAVVIDNGYDQVNVSGLANLDGTLEIQLINGFTPSLGDTFTILTFGSLEGGFANLIAPTGFGPESNLFFEIVENPNSENPTSFNLVVREFPVTAPAEISVHVDTATTENINQVLTKLADRTELLKNDLLISLSEIIIAKIPGTDVTLDELFSLSEYLNIGTYIDHYLHPILNPDTALPTGDLIPVGPDSKFSLDGLLNYLESEWFINLLGGQGAADPFTGTLLSASNQLTGFTLAFDGSANYTKEIPVGLSQVVDGIRRAYVDQDITIDASFAFDLSVSWENGTLAFDFNMTRLQFDAALVANDLVIPMMIGGLEASAGHPNFTKASIALDVHADVTADPTTGAYAVVYNPDATSSVNLNLPLYATLAGVDVTDTDTPVITIAGNIYQIPVDGTVLKPATLTPVGSELTRLTDFAAISVSVLKTQLESIRDNWLAEIAGTSQFNIDIPFTDSTLAALNFGEAFDIAVLAKLDFTQINSLQDFVAELNRHGLLQAGENVSFNTATKEISIPLAFDVNLSEIGMAELDTIARVNLELLVAEKLVQADDLVDPDDLLDNTLTVNPAVSFATINDLVTRGLLNSSSIKDWGLVDRDALLASGVLGPQSLNIEDLILPGDMVNLDKLVDAGLVTLGELAEADLINLGTIVHNLGFIRQGNSVADVLVDFEVDLWTPQVDLVDMSQMLARYATEALGLEALFDLGLLNLGDLGLDSLNISSLIDSGLVTFQSLVQSGLITATNFLDTFTLDITQLNTIPRLCL